jgi:2-methylcitrate dehydratase PrpD
MSYQPTDSKRLLSYTIAEWACSLKYEHLSPAAIQAAKLFWFDSIGCALGGSQQDDAKILLKHYQAMSATADSSRHSGQSHSTRVDVPKGDPRDPMTEEEIAVKFTALGGDIIGKEQCKKLQNFHHEHGDRQKSWRTL